ncbi:hypothetical protein LZ554_009175 [Drepanopeziza brunnea f. sp. 'monogermtubi']|nr:hypothetical protein LZ554_009175 [Drepanopeziza brunnea f. sp. 'monogermtubi']
MASQSDHEAQAKAADSSSPQPNNPVPTSNNPSSPRVRDLCSSLPKLKVNNDAAAVVPLPIASFPQFARLAIELRCKIWMHASFHPRIIPLKTRLGGLEPASSGAQQLQAQARVPAVLHACVESRSEAQRVYTICIATSVGHAATIINLTGDNALGAAVVANEEKEGEEPHGWNFVIHPGHTLPEEEARFPPLPGHTSKYYRPSNRIPNRVYFVNFAADHFCHPRVHSGDPTPFRLYLFLGPRDPPRVPRSFALSNTTPTTAGATTTAAAGPRPLITRPIHGALVIREFNFAADVLARIERLVVPVEYSAAVLPVLAKMPLLQSCAAATATALREIVCEVAAVGGGGVGKEERGVEGCLEMVEWEGKVAAVVRGMEDDGGDGVKPFEGVEVRVDWIKDQDQDEGDDDDLAPASAGSRAVGAVSLMENDGLDCVESEDRGGSLN